MDKHTPSPWSANIMPYRATVHAEGGVVADVIEGDSGKERQAANARLIAAAPDLLKALEVTKARLDLFGENSFARKSLGQTIDAAIAKAKGK